MTFEALLTIYAVGAIATAVIVVTALAGRVHADAGGAAAFAVVVILAVLWPLLFLFYFAIGAGRGIAWLWWEVTSG